MTIKATLDKRYSDMLKRFCRHFEKTVDPLDKTRGTKTGYVFIFDRSGSDSTDPGYVDIASNLTTESIINTLEAALLRARMTYKYENT